jgi:hypothetical protein
MLKRHEVEILLKAGDSWDRLLHQGVHLLQRFAQQNRIRIHHPRKNLQVKVVCSLSGSHQFISYVDAIGTLDGAPCILDWKTTTSRYPEGPDGVLSLDPQLFLGQWHS